MTIHFYIDNEEETELFTLYDQFIAPFKVGDEIQLSVDDLHPKDYINNKKYDNQIRSQNNSLKELCHLKTAKIIRMNNYATFSTRRNRITVEYHCEILDK